MINRLLTISAQATMAIFLMGNGWTGAAAQQPFNTPFKDLLPAAPKPKAQKPSAFVDQLAEVPELLLTDPAAVKKTAELVSQIAGINYLNREKSDGFMECLLKGRPDLAGLPFQMGNGCRLSAAQSRYFKQAAAMVHKARDTQSGTEMATLTVNRWPTALMTDNFASERKRVQNGLKVLRAAEIGGRIDQVKIAEIHKASAMLKAKLFEVRFDVSVTDYANALEFLSKLDEPVSIFEKTTVLPVECSAFLARFTRACLADDDSIASDDMKEHEEYASSARLAAMTQICGPTSESMKLAMVKYVASVSSIDSTRALVKTILFTPEEDARNLAINALKARREKDYVDALLQGFRYPWPEVAKHAADVLVKLDRKDLVPQIIDVLNDADPRAPAAKKVNGKNVFTVREIVRVNHRQNCLMCHAPGKDVQSNADILTAETPTPEQPTRPYYISNNPELLVRIDVTYLRQDFSMMLPVDSTAVWPDMQRFDFFVRTRTLNDDEVKEYKDKFDKLEQPPNRQAALAALRELTGKDAGPTAEAWRKLVKTP